ncbi:MAG: glycerate kinase [Pseudodesulfovibrio sp.]|nr:glycerate kinase [Pseudodesulfovibrio sp.]
MTEYTQKRKDLLHIIDCAIAAVSPESAMHAALSLDGDILKVADVKYDLSEFARILVVGAGKASAPMARALEAILDNRIQGGMIVTKYGHGLELKKITLTESAHPVPDIAGEQAAHALLDIARGATQKDLAFCLLSGGASALVPAPHHPVTLDNKQTTTRLLLECGATINEINAVRKHLSEFKGGHLAKVLEPATVITLIISDVVGDHLDVIGSGPTAPDQSTFRDCLDILTKYDLNNRIPGEVIKLLKDGETGMAPETLKADDSCFNRVRNVVIAGNAMALNGAANAAREMGYAPIIVNAAMQGEAREMAKCLIREAGEACECRMDTNPPICLLAGGETTVTITGKGRGGRNQEMALAAALELCGLSRYKERISLACVGTDGNDGPTDAAGALVLPDTLSASGAQNLSARQHLADNNSYAFFTDTGTILKTGPTRTNVMDIAIILVDPA